MNTRESYYARNATYQNIGKQGDMIVKKIDLIEDEKESHALASVVYESTSWHYYPMDFMDSQSQLPSDAHSISALPPSQHTLECQKNERFPARSLVMSWCGIMDDALCFDLPFAGA